MVRINEGTGGRARGVTRSRPRCAQCQRFARLLPGEDTCAVCSGVLALEFPVIRVAGDAGSRGGW